MSIETDAPVDEITHEELSTQYSKIGDELFFGQLPADSRRDELYERRLELWKEMESRVSVSFPDCPNCGNNSWSQTPGDPKYCTACDYEPRRTELIERIDESWEEILNH